MRNTEAHTAKNEQSRRSNKEDPRVAQYEALGAKGDKALNQDLGSLRAKTWGLWKVVGDALLAGISLAAMLAGTVPKKDDKKAMQKYKTACDEAFDAFLDRHHLGEEHLHKTTRYRLRKCMKYKDQIDAWMAKSKVIGEPAVTLNHPVTVWKAFCDDHPGIEQKERKKPGARHGTGKGKPESSKQRAERAERDKDAAEERAREAEAAYDDLKAEIEALKSGAKAEAEETEVTEALKEEMGALKAKAEEADDLKAQVKTLKAKVKLPFLDDVTKLAAEIITSKGAGYAFALADAIYEVAPLDQPRRGATQQEQAIYRMRKARKDIRFFQFDKTGTEG